MVDHSCQVYLIIDPNFQWQSRRASSTEQSDLSRPHTSPHMSPPPSDAKHLRVTRTATPLYTETPLDSPKHCDASTHCTNFSTTWTMRSSFHLPYTAWICQFTTGDFSRLELSTHSAAAKCSTSDPHIKQNIRFRYDGRFPEHPPIIRHIQKAQLKLFGHFPRSYPNAIERKCCFQYRGGTAGLRGRRRL